ncbi:hypothetical protein KZ829_28465 [Actinoplanes hulinensis]|uniref:Pentapeptide repeat-containing protein n=1 Tax=Actinoplanes hulinensis TaxID=1144547 RepID=A0ABS7B9Q2_9ACTN|nr:hypothetical protein [Actinoplanes hulinensis]MBW6437675.1 hypothetical protein [Actinoplanes hulinensis]
MLDKPEEAIDSRLPKTGETEKARTHKDIPELHLWPIHYAVALAMLGGIALVTAFVWAGLWQIGFPTLKRDGSVSATTLIEFLKLAFAVVAGIGGIVALIVAYRRQRVVESSNKLAEINSALAHLADERAEASRLLAEAADRRASIENDRSGIRLLNERFTKSAEQLGSDHPAIRLAGAYSMASLADDWPEERQTCIDVLCGYLRMTPGNITDDNEVRRTIARIIVAHLRVGARISWQGHRFDLADSEINEWDFRNIAVGKSTVLNLEGASFGGAKTQPSFRNMKVAGGSVHLTRINFTKGVELSGLELEAGLVNLQGSQFFGWGAGFDSASINGGLLDLRSCTFNSGATFGSYPQQWVKIEGGSINLSFSKFLGDSGNFPSCSFNLEITGGNVSFEHTKFEGTGVHFRNSRLLGGSMNFDFASTANGHANFSKVLFEGCIVDYSKPYGWQRPPLLPDDAAVPPGEFKLPAPDWKFDDEPPF